LKEVKNKPALRQSDNLHLSWRDHRYYRFYEVVDYLVQELQEHVWIRTGKAKRRLKGAGLQKLNYSVECLVRDCMAVILQRKRKGEASIRRGQHHYAASRPDQMLTYSIHIERAFDGLLELGYLEVTRPGYFDRNGRKDGTPTSRLTRYIASDKLLSLFTETELEAIPVLVPPYRDPDLIRIRVKERDEHGVIRKSSLEVRETTDTQRMRENLSVINNALSKHWYDLQIPDDELSELQKRLADDPENERTIRMDQRSLYRVFNDPELRTGGRFYGGWWQNIPRDYRKHMIVNGKKMVELDYSNQHPSILYAREGVARPYDCYTNVIPLNTLPDGATQRDLRDMVKSAFNAMLNSEKPLRQAPDGVLPSKFGLKWSDISEAIISFHKPIAHHFYTGAGIRLQRIDSDIAERVMLHFVQDGIAILPLHDSFLMHNGYETWLEPVMHEVFENVVGIAPKIDRKTFRDSPMEEKTVADNEVTLSIKEIIASNSGHDHRLDAFYNLKNNANKKRK